MNAQHPTHDDLDWDETPFYVVRTLDSDIPDEHYCLIHLISESEYVQKHGLASADDSVVEPICCAEDDDYESCPDCANVPPSPITAIQHTIAAERGPWMLRRLGVA